MKNNISKRLLEATQPYWDKRLLDLTADRLVLSGSIAPLIKKYRNKKVPVYFTIKYPTIEKHFDNEYGDFEGYLIVFKEKKLFKIGTKVERVPIYKYDF